MKCFVTDQRDVKQCLTKIKKAIPSKSPRKELTCVKFMVDGSVFVHGNDAEMGVTALLPVDYACNWQAEMLVDYRKLVSVINKLSGELTFDLTDPEKLIIKSLHSSLSIPTGDLEEYRMLSRPSEQEKKDQVTFDIPADRLKHALSQVSFATDTESTRYALGGVLFELEGGTLHLVATDSRRLAVMHTTVDRSSGSTRCVVPASAVDLISAHLTGGTEVQVQIREHDFTFYSETMGWAVQGRQVEGRFPKYQDVIPDIWNLDTVEMQADCLTKAIQSANTMASAEDRGMDFDFDSSYCRLTGGNKTDGFCTSEMAIFAPGHEFHVRLDPGLLLDWLKAAKGKDIFMHYTDGSSPVVFSGQDTSNFVLMPLTRDDATKAKKPTVESDADAEEPEAVQAVPDPEVEPEVSPDEGGWDDNGDFEDDDFGDDDDDDDDDDDFDDDDEYEDDFDEPAEDEEEFYGEGFVYTTAAQILSLLD